MSHTYPRSAHSVLVLCLAPGSEVSRRKEDAVLALLEFAG